MASIDQATEGDSLRDLIAAYGQLADSDDTQAERSEQLAELVVCVINFFGVHARRSRPGQLATTRTIALPLPSGSYLMEIGGLDEPVTLEQATAVRRVAASQPALRSVLLSMSGFAPETLDPAAESAAAVVLLDRPHIEAIICGVVAPDVLFGALAQRALFDEQPYTSLGDLLLEPAPRTPPQCATPDRLPPRWPLLDRAAPNVQVRQLLGGRTGWPDVLGATALDDQRLLVTTADGLIEVHLKRGTTEWALPLHGCRGAPLLQADGVVLTLCNDGIVAWRDGQIIPLAGGFHDAICLLAGPGGEPWLLSGAGPAYGSGRSTLALSRLGLRPGQQQSYGIRFDASVHGAGWLSGRKFFLAAGSNSAIVDLARSSTVQYVDWIPSPHSYPNHVAVVDERTVLTASTDGHGVGATVYQTDPATRTNELVTALVLNQVQAMTVGPAGTVYLVGDVRGNDVHIPDPVIVRIALAPRVIAKSVARPSEDERIIDSYHDVRVTAKGSRRDYALDPRPIERGGQATVTGARHKGTGTRVAFKHLTSRSPEQIARMRREIEAAQLFGDNPHVVPVLDFSTAYDWFVMPLATDTAEQAAEELQDTERLHELVTAICNALRRPHEQGWIHRDLKPANILKLAGLWTIADWGLGRRPRGQTSNPGRTHTGTLYGTEGFAAPELAIDAHDAGPQTDIYSIGQIIGWAQTGKWPQVNRPLLPTSGPWRTIVEATTHDDPALRPANVDQFLGIVAAALAGRNDRFEIAPDTGTRSVSPIVESHSGRSSPIDEGHPHSSAVAATAAIETDRQATAGADIGRSTATAAETQDQPAQPVTVKGILGSISFDGNAVTVRKQGYGPRMKGSQTLLISQIESIVVKPASRLFHGYIQFIVHGRPPAPEQKGLLAGGRPHREDLDSMSYSRLANSDIDELRQQIETSISNMRATER